eukprot:2974748-Pleurochrysis_carterae.AAC.2
MSVCLSYRLDSAAPPNDPRGGAVPTNDYKAYTRCSDGALGVASQSTLLSRSRYLVLQCLASIIAANGRGDYGRASGKLLPEHTTRPWGQRQRALLVTLPTCAQGINSKTHEGTAL